jgi:hypothetical protein
MDPRIYVYKVTFVDRLFWYWGVHKEKKFDEYYMGSPVTNKSYWGLYTPTKEIIEVFEYSNEGWKEALNLEILLIKRDWHNPNCLNCGCGGSASPEIIRALWSDSNFCERMSHIRKKQWEDPEYAEKAFSGLKAYWEDPNAGLKHSAIIKEAYKNPLIREPATERILKLQPEGVKAALSTKAREKRKATMTANKHAQGEKNSQYGTRWITNGLINEKIKSSCQIPEGFWLGRTML